MAEWMVRLKGENSDLRYLSARLSLPGLNVIEEEGSYYLKNVDFNSLTNAADVYQKAGELIPIIKGAVKVLSGGFCAIEVDYVTFIDDEGKRYNHYFIEPACGQLRISGMDPELTVIKPNGTLDSSPNPNPSTLERYIEIARKDGKVNKALRFFSSSEPRWYALYKVLDVIEEDLGGGKKLEETQWASKEKIELFRRTANNFRAIGYEARHGHEKYQPPERPMSLSEAESLMADLFNKWLQSKA